jgi:hypothetical protein
MRTTSMAIQVKRLAAASRKAATNPLELASLRDAMEPLVQDWVTNGRTPLSSARLIAQIIVMRGDIPPEMSMFHSWRTTDGTPPNLQPVERSLAAAMKACVFNQLRTELGPELSGLRSKAS